MSGTGDYFVFRLQGHDETLRDTGLEFTARGENQIEAAKMALTYAQLEWGWIEVKHFHLVERISRPAPADSAAPAKK
jgi:hypothetical protein